MRDHVLNPEHTQPEAGALCREYAGSTEGGNCYTFEDIRDTLHAAGFVRAGLIQDGEKMNGLVEAFKP